MRGSLGWTVILLGALCMGHTCGLDSSDKGEGAPCTRSRDCAEGLVCIGGSCARPDVSPDGGDVDGAAEDADTPDA
jgi:hypothetical protein